MTKKVWSKVIFFIGWILSPFTWWNDTFVNLPIAYALASVHNYFFQRTFSAGVIAYYWFTNIIGILMVYFGGRELFMKEFGRKKRLNFIFTVAVYSLILAALSFKGIIRPFQYGR